ncbi:hypothetical protein KI688_009271 [Linnemannia hyalina]|uniref:FAD-binding domain-containing protein n=1 Tax=Linnemannia hyalina TaxID=64524 RepID=A0A9P7XZ04_9FUNG|nr:hypothetical protein KI688_009271 [Linnemannia hyalina]
MTSFDDDDTKAAILDCHVCIVGAGIGGLMMGILFERADIKYTILEKHPFHNPLGSAICLEPSVQPLFRQLGLMDEIHRLSKPFGALVFREDNLDIVGTFNAQTPLNINDRYGGYNRIIARRDLCALLAAQIPKEKIKFGKRVLEVRQNAGEVIIRCSDNSVHHADILVGCDGAYSAVRQGLYADLSESGELPKQDNAPMGYQYDCLVGVTDPMDPSKIPSLASKFSEFQTILSKDANCSYWCIPLVGNRISWMVVKFHNKGKKYGEDQLFKLSGWGAEAAELMSYEFRELITTYGCELGELMDNTPKGSMAKVMLEEKFYKTWYKGRVVLTGDAVHKVLPFGGQGANQCIHDVLALTNLLVQLKSNTVPDIEELFESYFKARSPIGRTVVNMSSRLGNLMNRKGMMNDIIRKLALRHMPRWISQIVNDRWSYDRPQLECIPFVEVPGELQPRPQKRSAYVPASLVEREPTYE